MKIVRIIARLNVGGPARHVVWLTAGLRKPEFDSLLVAGKVPPGEDDMAYFAGEMGVSPLFIPEMSREVSPGDVLTIWKLYRLFLRERPDIVHTHTAKAGTVGRIAGLFYRWLTPAALLGRPRPCRFVHTYHGHIFHSYYGPATSKLFLAIERVLARIGTDRIVVLSEQQRREINEEFRVGRSNQFRTIPLGLDTEAFANWKDRRLLFRDELSAAPGDTLVGIVGRLTQIKNHDLFLRAVVRYREKYGTRQPGRRVRFVVIGDGNLRRPLEEKTRALGIRDDVTFVGTRRDPASFYPGIDIVALTSRNEGTPLTLIEAMANARPVIATAVGGVVDLLGNEAPADRRRGDLYEVCERGVRVRPGDANAFAAGLARLIEDEELRRTIGERGRQFVEQTHSRHRLLEDMMALYQEAILREPIAVKAGSRETSLESRI